MIYQDKRVSHVAEPCQGSAEDHTVHDIHRLYYYTPTGKSTPENNTHTNTHKHTQATMNKNELNHSSLMELKEPIRSSTLSWVLWFGALHRLTGFHLSNASEDMATWSCAAQ